MNPLLERLRLMLITDGGGDVDRIETIVAAALSGGVTAVQVREPGLGARGLDELCRRLWPLVRSHDALLLVNDRLDVAAGAHAHGVHLGHRSLRPGRARAILGPRKLVGFSAHGAAEIAAADQEGADYVTLSPVYDTDSKPGAEVLGRQRAGALVAGSPLPVILLGGLHVQTLPDACTLNAHGYAVMSAVFEAAEPELTARLLWEVISS